MGAGVRSVRGRPAVQTAGTKVGTVTSEDPMIPKESCVSGAVQMLLELRAALSDGTNAVQVERIDEAIRLLREGERQHGFDTGKIADAMRLLGEGIALIPAMMDLLRKFDP